jgi:hypothetical protein
MSIKMTIARRLSYQQMGGVYYAAQNSRLGGIQVPRGRNSDDLWLLSHGHYIKRKRLIFTPALNNFPVAYAVSDSADRIDG